MWPRDECPVCWRSVAVSYYSGRFVRHNFLRSRTACPASQMTYEEAYDWRAMTPWREGTGSAESDADLLALYCDLMTRRMKWLEECVQILRDKYGLDMAFRIEIEEELR